MNKKEVIILVIGLLFVISTIYYAVYQEYSTALRPSPLPDNMIVYSYGANGLVAKQQGDDISYYHKDHLGSTGLVTDSDGEVVSKSEYYPFGESFREQGEERYKYTGKEEDASGLYYYGARYYDASIGRFISVDPIKSYDSPYVYVRNNPMKYVDPSGMEEKNALMLIASEKGKMLPEFVESYNNKLNALIKEGYSQINLGLIENEIDVANAIAEVGSQNKIDYITLISHASSNALLLGEGDTSPLEISDLLNKAPYQSLKQYFNKGATGEIGGCDTAMTCNYPRAKGLSLLQATSNKLGIPMTGTIGSWLGYGKGGEYLTGSQGSELFISIYIRQDVLIEGHAISVTWNVNTGNVIGTSYARENSAYEALAWNLPMPIGIQPDTTTWEATPEKLHPEWIRTEHPQ